MKIDIPHYRYEREYFYFGNPLNDKGIILLEFKAVRETKQGYWLKLHYKKEKFVLKDSKKRYAYPTKEEAFNSFVIRTIKSFDYASRDVENAKEFIKLINNHELNKKEIKLTN
jgi:hypothetical protein